MDRPVSEPSKPESSPTLTRSVTVPPPRNDPIDPKPTRSVNLERSKTTINVAPNARERIGGAESDAGRSVGSMPLSRSMTSVRPDRNAGGPAPVKALSVRRPRGDGQGSPLPPPPPPDRASKPKCFLLFFPI